MGPGPHQFQDLNNHSQSPLAEGRGRKEVGAEASGAPSRALGGGKAGPKCSELLRNVSVHAQMTEAEIEEHHKHRPQFPHL